jgi:hypothetical protein
MGNESAAKNKQAMDANATKDESNRESESEERALEFSSASRRSTQSCARKGALLK